MKSIGILGAGAWGTALANVAARGGEDALIWALEAEVAASINDDHVNNLYLPDASLEPSLKATTELADFSGCDVVLVVSPAQFLRSVVTNLKSHIEPDTPLIICSKGIEISSGKLLSEVIEEIAPGHPIGVLSGPTFAIETAKFQPSALTLAMKDEDLGKQLVERLGQPTFRPYYTDDIVGAQIGGAVKNVLAIATGIVYGQKMGENAKAAVITRGLAEMVRFGAVYGARSETLMGLSGLGDLVLTCSSLQSRNMSLGKALGEGQSMEEIMAGRISVSEGAHTVKILHKLALEHGIDMPICESVHRIIVDGDDVTETAKWLLSRPFTDEII